MYVSVIGLRCYLLYGIESIKQYLVNCDLFSVDEIERIKKLYYCAVIFLFWFDVELCVLDGSAEIQRIPQLKPKICGCY